MRMTKTIGLIMVIADVVMTASAALETISPVLSGEMLHVLNDMGHGEEIIVSDANFPAHSVCDRVIRADWISADVLLKGMAPLFPLDSYSIPVCMMSPVPGDDLDPKVEARYRDALGYTNRIERIDRFAFYKRAKRARAVIVTGEAAKYGNVIIKKGIVQHVCRHPAQSVKRRKVSDASGCFWQEELPRPIFDEDPSLVEFYNKAWKLAHNRIDEVPGLPAPRYMDEAHRSDRVWIWDTCFMAHFCKYCPKVFPGIESLENFYCVMLADKAVPLPKVRGNVWCDDDAGKMLDFRIHHPDNPPLFAWTEYVYALQTGDRARLEKIYRDRRWLQRWFELFESFDPAAPQPHGAVCKVALKKEKNGYRWRGCPCGMDNTPRGREGTDDHGREHDCPNNPDLLWVDAIAQQGLSALYLSRIAALLGDAAGEKTWKGRYEELKAKVNELYWDDSDGFYYDILHSTGAKVKVPTAASFWPLLAEMAPKDRERRMLSKLTDDSKFGGPMPVPSVSRDDPDFHADGTYWRGSVWMPTAYMAVKAADICGDYATARQTARKIVNMMNRTYTEFEPHTIWECYSPTEPKPATNKRKEYVRHDFCGWSALGPISLFIEDVIGIKEANAFTNTLVCDFEKDPKGRVGVENYRFGRVVCSVVVTKDEIKVCSNLQFSLKADGRVYSIQAGNNAFER